MAPFDVPHVTHDMLLRFMGVNFTAIVEGSAKIPSTIGNIAKPIFVEENEATPQPVAPAKTPQQDKAMWEGRLLYATTKSYNELMILTLQRTTTLGLQPSFWS